LFPVIPPGLNLVTSIIGPHRPPSRTSVARVAWACLAIVHAWPLFAVLSQLLSSPSLDRVGSLLLLAGLIAFSTAKALGMRILRSDRPRTELMVWLLAGGILHGADIRELDRMDLASIAASAGIGGTLIARRENRRRIANLLRSAADAIVGTAGTLRRPSGHAGYLAATVDVDRGLHLCERRTVRPPPARW